jgi:hypothetical protein
VTGTIIIVAVGVVARTGVIAFAALAVAAFMRFPLVLAAVILA